MGGWRLVVGEVDDMKPELIPEPSHLSDSLSNTNHPSPTTNH